MSSVDTATAKALDKAKAAKPKARKNKSAPKSKAPNVQTYADVKRILDKTDVLKEAPSLPIGRNDKKIQPRRFHLPQHKIAELAECWKKEKQFPNPHNKGGTYFHFVQALIDMGINKSHSFAKVKDTMRKAMSDASTKDTEGKTAWQRFVGKEAHTETEENALSIDGKLQQNAEVLQRLGGFTPYGLKLLQCGQLVLKTKGMVIDILKNGKDSKERMYRLNTNSDTPLNEFRRQRK